MFEREYLAPPQPARPGPLAHRGRAGRGGGRGVAGAGDAPRSGSTARRARSSGAGNGPIDAFCAALRAAGIADFSLLSYHEHALDRGSGSRAVAYIQIEAAGGVRLFGVGIDTDIAAASFRAILGALNRLAARRVPASNAGGAPET